MKKRWVATGMLLLALCLSACSVRDTTGETTAETTQADITQENTTSPVTTEETTSAPDDTSADSTDSEGEKQITEEEALAAAKAYMGDTDPDTGYKYSFVSEGIMQELTRVKSIIKSEFPGICRRMTDILSTDIFW